MDELFKKRENEHMETVAGHAETHRGAGRFNETTSNMSLKKLELHQTSTLLERGGKVMTTLASVFLKLHQISTYEIG